MVIRDRSGDSGGGGGLPSRADGRDQAAEQRDQAAEQRQQAAEQRQQAAEQRQQAAEQRDQAAEQRDQAAEQRDEAAEQRDQAGKQRDQAAQRPEEASLPAGLAVDAVSRSALARGEAASDRRGASQDRRSGANERTQAELDRNSALADRAASARDREQASVDEVTGVFLRGAGFVELERTVAAASRTQRPLVLAFVAVDHLKAVNDLLGHSAGDRMLLEIVSTLRATLRSYDLIIRYGDDEFVCAFSGLTMADAAKWPDRINADLAVGPEHKSVTVGLAELQPNDCAEDLVARADAALRKEHDQRGAYAVVDVWECGDLVIDEGTHLVTRAGTLVPLTATEFNLLVLLASNCTRMVPNSQLLGQVWGYDAGHHLLEVHMSSLRRKLEVHGSRIIDTIRGTGYVLHA